jgi:sugar fermentation stimulation protein A
MKYNHMREGVFLSRPNRFIAIVRIDGKEAEAHVKNTGRCKELFIPGTKIFLQEHDNPKRKTKYSLIGVMKGNRIINMDSQAPNKAVGEWLKQGGIYKDPVCVKAEQKYGNSRFDFYMEGDGKRALIEVKGVTLEENGVAKFPDAPTQRGIKHIEELMRCMDEGYEAYLIFVIQMKGVHLFQPNTKTHPAFADALSEAAAKGVHLIAVDCQVTKDQMNIDRKIKIQM